MKIKELLKKAFGSIAGPIQTGRDLRAAQAECTIAICGYMSAVIAKETASRVHYTHSKVDLYYNAQLFFTPGSEAPQNIDVTELAKVIETRIENFDQNNRRGGIYCQPVLSSTPPQLRLHIIGFYVSRNPETFIRMAKNFRAETEKLLPGTDIAGLPDKCGLSTMPQRGMTP